MHSSLFLHLILLTGHVFASLNKNSTISGVANIARKSRTSRHSRYTLFTLDTYNHASRSTLGASFPTTTLWTWASSGSRFTLLTLKCLKHREKVRVGSDKMEAALSNYRLSHRSWFTRLSTIASRSSEALFTFRTRKTRVPLLAFDGVDVIKA